MTHSPRRFSRILFLLPGPYVYEDRCQAYIRRGSLFSFREPVEEMAGAAVLQQRGAECAILHPEASMWSRKRTLRAVADFAPDLIILSTTFPGHNEDLAWIKGIKAAVPAARIAARGGQMAFVDAARLLERFPGLDGVLFGETDQVLGSLDLEDPAGSPGVVWRNGDSLVRGPDPGLVSDIDGLPFPARALVHQGNYPSPDTGRPMATVTASRGCPRQCAFCLAPAVSGNRFRLRSPRTVAEEIQECRARFGVENFFLRAEDLASPREWTLGLCEELCRKAAGIRFVCAARADGLDADVAAALSRAGCWGVSVGVESGSARTLEQSKKALDPSAAFAAVENCRSQGIVTLAYFLVGFPWETRRDVQATLRLAKNLKSPVTEIFFPYPYPGTGLYGLAKEAGLVNQDNPPRRSQQVPVFLPKDMTARELLSLRNRTRLAPGNLLRSAGAMLSQAEDLPSAARILRRLAGGWRAVL
ncbi:MAG: radical SAM protein [Deltaproteobacteria bacterium]|nr:radical SAM protein [Deltaproteobacteria bacterium]